MIDVHVQLFSVLRERVGRDRLTVSLPDDAAGSDLLSALAGAYPPIAAYRSVIRLAVNEHYEPLDTPLQAGDRVALITPVSGG